MTPPESREDFCQALRAARKRRGVTLQDIAAITKVCTSHYEALERGDLRCWPKGIFRRTFFKGYVENIGLPVAETMDAFIALFPEDASAAPPQPAATETALRLDLDASWHGPKTPLKSRLIVALSDAFAVIAIAVPAAIAGVNIATAAAIAAMAYFTLGMVLFGESPAARAKRSRNVSAAPDVATPTQDVVIVREEPPAQELPRERPWVSDARRVRPRDMSPRTRVRIKLPAPGGMHH